MKIVFRQNLNKGKVVVAQTGTEHEILFTKLKNHLTKEEQEIYSKIKNNKRKKEWLAVRFLLMQEIGSYHEIFYTETGNPFVKNNKNISISHSENLIALSISKNNTGIDIQVIEERINRISYKFVSDTERKFTENKAQITTLIWSAKECLFKIHQKGNLDFKSQLHISEITDKTLNAVIKIQESEKVFTLNYKFLKTSESNEAKDFALVWFI